MFKFALTIVLAIPCFLAGCMMPVYSWYPPELVDESTLDTFIGKDKKAILIALGPPNDVQVSNSQSYFIYSDLGDESQIAYVLFVPLGARRQPRASLFCVLLEFDKRDILRGYSIEHRSRYYPEKLSVDDCALVFFDVGKLRSF